jgi:hypothetical protein
VGCGKSLAHVLLEAGGSLRLWRAACVPCAAHAVSKVPSKLQVEARQRREGHDRREVGAERVGERAGARVAGGVVAEVEVLELRERAARARRGERDQAAVARVNLAQVEM